MLLEKIVKTPRREVAGARTQKRFDYQKHWAICKILDIHNTFEDYLVLLEYHDDVAILNHSSIPTEIEFYQVKTIEKPEAKPWNASGLTSKKTNGNSILGKLYLNKINFSEATSVSFISNHNFEFALKGGKISISHNHLKFDDLDQTLQTQLMNKLVTELSLTGKTLADFHCIQFEVCPLTPSLQEELTRERISRFIENSFVGISYQIAPVYKSLFAEISKVSNFDKEIADVQGLLEKKGITKAMVNDIFRVITTGNNNTNLEQLRLNIEANLRTEGVQIADILTMRSSWREFEVSHLQRDAMLQKIDQQVGLCIKEAQTTGALKGTNTIQACEIILQSYLKKPVLQTRFSNDVIKSMILYNIYAA